MARPPTFHHLAVTFVALALFGCKRNIYPLTFVGPPAGDSSVAPDSSVPIGDCPDPGAPVGFATMSYLGGEPDGSTDAAPWDGGGVGPLGAGSTVLVDATESDALSQFSTYAGDKTPGPLTILVRGMITIPPPTDGGSADDQKIRVSSNKTVIGLNVAAGPSGSGFLGGGLVMTKVSNVTLRNLMIQMPNSDDSSDNVDAIHIEGSTQIWVDHCDLSSSGNTDAGASYDDLIGITDKSDFVTVSWTHYHDHRDTGIVGRSENVSAEADDVDKEHITFDHDYFQGVASGPRLRFGTMHVLNCFFDTVENYGVAAIDGATVRVEASAFRNVTVMASSPDYGPVTTYLSGALSEGYVDLVNSPVAAPNGKNNLTTATVPFTLPYPYKPDLVSSVPAVVMSCAATGVIATPAPP
ncbi:MAG TPA: hypothetical protein VKZ18_03905 [Polyangia bacterium]|nr:hypothetical protein [Polyangia bacterium]